MSTKASKLKEFIRHLIRQELKELEEVSVTGNLDGGEGPPRTPYAFYGGRKKDKEKKKRIAQAGGYMKVKESVNEAGMELNKLKDAIKMFQKKIDKQVKMNVRLKNELNVDSRSYWKNTHKALGKISERLVKLANKVGQLK